MKQSLYTWFKKHQAGNIEEALCFYKEYLESSPNDIDALQLYGIAHSQLEHYEDALDIFKHALSLNPDHIALHNNIGHLYIKLQKFTEGKTHFDIVLTHQPSHIGALNNLGLLHYKQKEFATAEAYFHKASLLNEHDSELFYNLGLSQFNQKELKSARRSFLSAHNLDPDNTNILIQLGECDLQSKLYESAIEFFRKAIKDDKSFRLLHGIGCAYLGNNQHEKALDCFNQAYDLEPFNFENCHNLASIYFHQQRLVEALQCWFQCLQMQPNDVQTLYNIGVVYQYQNKFEDAGSYFHKVLAQDANHINALHNLGTLSLKQNKPQKAIEFYQRVAKITPNNDQVNFLLSALQQRDQDAFSQCPETYVTQLFNDYAPTYDQHLTQVLRYNGHQKLCELIEDTLEPRFNQWSKIVDLGCGTGLASDYLKPWTPSLIGVDCASNMIELARKKDQYDEFLLGYLPNITWPKDVGLFFLADCLPYLGGLENLVHAMGMHLQPGGIIACSIETSTTSEQYHLETSGRFQHNRNYLIQLMQSQALTLLDCKQATTRYEQHHPVNNELFIFQKNQQI